MMYLYYLHITDFSFDYKYCLNFMTLKIKLILLINIIHLILSGKNQSTPCFSSKYYLILI